MCRLVALPPNFPRDEALEIIHNFVGHNKDGFGSAYVKNGEFIVDKSEEDFTTLVKKRDLLSHMPYPGWTIAHVRAVSWGAKALKNTHPFIHGDVCLMHNGTWTEHYWLRKGLELGATKVNWEGETDSETAAWMLNRFCEVSPKTAPVDFFNSFIWSKTSSAFLALNRAGELFTFRTDKIADMDVTKTRYGWLIASDLNYSYKAESPKFVVGRFNPKGDLEKYWVTK